MKRSDGARTKSEFRPEATIKQGRGAVHTSTAESKAQEPTRINMAPSTA